MTIFRRACPRSAAWPLLACAFTAWWAFAPGLFSPDSIDQIQQAMGWSFDDWHPPFPAVVAGILFKLGLPVAALTLATALAWAVSCGLVIDAGISRHAGENGRADAESRGRTLFWLVLLAGWACLPPWPFYAVTFWKDCWTAIGLLLLTAGLLRASSRQSPGSPALSSPMGTRAVSSARWAQALMLAGVTLAALSRHNAGVLLPLAGLGIALAEPNTGLGAVNTPRSASRPRTSRRYAPRRYALRLLGFLLPFALVFAVGRALPLIAPIATRPITSVIMAHELAIAVLAEPDLATRLPYAANNVAPRYSVTIERGDLAALVRRTWWLGPDLGRTLDTSRIREEYGVLIRTRPRLVAELKIRSWIALWNTTGATFWHQEIIEPNDLGLAWSLRDISLRDTWLTWSHELRRNPATRILLAGHFPWMLGGFILVLAGAIRFAILRDTSSALAFLASAAPMLYALSFLAAYAVADYRYLYPATLAVQCMLLGFTRSGSSALEGLLRGLGGRGLGGVQL